MANFKFNKTMIDVEINGETYIATVDIKTIAHFKKKNKTSFLSAVQSLSELDELATIKLLGSVIRKNEKAEPVGAEFFNDYNPLAVIEVLAPVLVEAMGTNMPEAEGEEEKK